jgi:hypothetical protein
VTQPSRKEKRLVFWDYAVPILKCLHFKIYAWNFLAKTTLATSSDLLLGFLGVFASTVGVPLDAFLICYILHLQHEKLKR